MIEPYFETELGKLYHGDCLEIMPELEPVDLVVTSPPYNCGIKYGLYDDNRPWEEYMAWCEEWLSEIYKIMNPDGRLCLNVLMEMGIEDNKKRVSPFAEFYNLFKRVGIKGWGSPVWVDSHRVKYTAWGSWLKASAPYIYNPYEIIMIGYKEYWKKQTKGESTISKEEFMMGCSGIWRLKTQTKEITKANFHTDLPNMCIKLLSYDGNIILDSFMGGGTTAIACERLNRRWIGIEIEERYCEISAKRIEKENQQLKLF